MQLSDKKKAIIITLILIFTAGSFLWVRSYVFSDIGMGIHKKIQSLQLSGFNVRYDSLSIDWLGNVVEIHHLLLEKNPYDTACVYPEFLVIGKVRAENFRLFALIFRKTLDFKSLYLEKARIMMRENSLLTLDSTIFKESEFTLRVENVFIHSADFKYTDNLHCKMSAGVQSDITIRGLKMESRNNQPYQFGADELMLDSIRVELPEAFYSFQIRQARIDFLANIFTVDSIKVIPHFTKLEFGSRRGYEVDRVEGLIPYVKIKDFIFSFQDSIRIKVGRAEVQFFMKIFRDKHLPFRNKIKPFLLTAIRELPVDLVIDSLKIANSYVEYEERAEGSPDPGGIFFDNLYAVFSNINNRSKMGNTRLVAQASLMGQGDVQLSAVFPFDNKKRSTLKGSLKNFSIPKINSMLTPITNIEVENGKLKQLLFHFSFNEIRSDGEIELNYEDLKLVSFKEYDKDNDGEWDKDNFKTFILNLFVFRKNMNEKVPAEKRTGTIMFYRDNTRSIFNFWAKSLMSGIKSAYKLDKIAEKKEERQLKKEARVVKRQARKLKRAVKKKEKD